MPVFYRAFKQQKTSEFFPIVFGISMKHKTSVAEMIISAGVALSKSLRWKTAKCQSKVTRSSEFELFLDSTVNVYKVGRLLC